MILRWGCGQSECIRFNPFGFPVQLSGLRANLEASYQEHRAALHFIHLYIHNTGTKLQDRLCQDQLVATDTSVVDNLKAHVSELEEKLAIAEEATTTAEQMEIAKEAIRVAERKSKVLAEELMAAKVTDIQRGKAREGEPNKQIGKNGSRPLTKLAEIDPAISTNQKRICELKEELATPEVKPETDSIPDPSSPFLSVAPAGPDNTMPEQIHSATANRPLRPSLSLDTAFSHTDAVSSHIDAVSPPLPQPRFLIGGGTPTEEQYEQFWTMSSAELRLIFVKSGISPISSEDSENSPMIPGFPDWDYELEDYVPDSEI